MKELEKTENREEESSQIEENEPSIVSTDNTEVGGKSHNIQTCVTKPAASMLHTIALDISVV